MYEAKETRSFGANGAGNVSVLRLSLATFLAYPKKSDIYVLTDYDRWCDRKNTKLNPPFFFWQKLKIDADECAEGTDSMCDRQSAAREKHG